MEDLGIRRGRFVGDEEDVKHEITPGAGVEETVDPGRNITVGTFDSIDNSSIATDEEGHFEGVGGDDGVIVRLEWFFPDGFHAVESNGFGVTTDLVPFGEEAEEVADFVSDSAHFPVVISEAEDAIEVWAGEDEFSAGSEDTEEVGEEGFGFFDMFKNVKGTDGIEGGVVEGQAGSVVPETREAAGFGFFDTGFGDFDAPGVVSLGAEAGYDLSGSASDVQDASGRSIGTECIGVFIEKRWVLAIEEIGIGLVFAIRFGVSSHRRGTPLDFLEGLPSSFVEQGDVRNWGKEKWRP